MEKRCGLAFLVAVLSLLPAPAPGGTFVEKDGVVSMEAENCSWQTGYTVVENKDASGGKVMQVGQGSGELRFDIEFKTGGRWYVWVRAFAAGHDNNGIFLKLDGQPVAAPAGHPYAGKRDIYLRKNTWSWSPEWQGPGSGQHKGPIAIDVTPGRHTLSIPKRKTERPLLDKIVLTTSNKAPTDLGPPETPAGGATTAPATAASAPATATSASATAASAPATAASAPATTQPAKPASAAAAGQ